MARRISLRGPYIKFGAWWVFWTALGTWIVYQFGFDLTVSLTDAAFTQLDWTIAGYVLNLMLQYYRPNSRNLINLLVFTLALAGLFTFVNLPWSLPYIISLVSDDPDYPAFVDGSLSIRFVIGWMQLLFVAAISWIWSFMEDQQQNEKRKADTESLARNAELTQLRQQLQPHFLFNSLNSINALVGTQPEEARKMVQQLSDFLRGTVKKDDRQLVSLAEELQHLGLYLEIEKVRFGYRLESSIHVDPETREKKLPPLLLQPIVENAIKFGLYDTVGEITISIETFLENNNLVVRIKNPYDPSTAQPQQGTGFGLNSITRRLYLIYSQNGLLTTSAEQSTFITTIKIPQV